MTIVATAVGAADEEPGVELMAAARQFYCDVLEAREIAPRFGPNDNAPLWFVVGGVLVETGYRRRAQPDSIVLRLDNPEELAARCWNAGYTVIVEESADALRTAALSVLDPFGLRIDLRPL